MRRILLFFLFWVIIFSLSGCLIMDFFKGVEYINPKGQSVVKSKQIDLKWKVEGNSRVNIYFGTSNPPKLVEEKYDKNVYTVTGLESNKKYYWKVEPISDTGITAISEIKMFSTGEMPLNPPYAPNPGNGLKNVQIDRNLSWKYEVPNNGIVKYDLFFGESVSAMVNVASNLSQTSYDIPLLKSYQEYFWKVVAYQDDRKSESEIWSFKTTSEPLKPTIVKPDASEKLNPESVYFEWSSVHSPQEAVMYDLYLGEESLELVAENINSENYRLYNLKSDSEYDFKICAKFGNGGISCSDVKSFCTAEIPPVVCCIFPENFRENVDIPLTLEWDYNSNMKGVRFKVFISESQYPEYFSYVDGYNSLKIDSLKHDTIYRWYIAAEIDGIKIAESSIYSFKTKSKENTPPLNPSNPIPLNGSSEVDLQLTLRWNCSDPDGDILRYDVYFGGSVDSLKKIITDTFYDSLSLDELENDTEYFWKIVVKDGNGGQNEGPVWKFKTVDTVEPADPEITYEYPLNNATGMQNGMKLLWNGRNFEYFKIFFGTSNNPSYIGNTASAQYIPNLEEGQTYFWRIVAVGNGKEKSGPVWSFSTSASEDDNDRAAREILHAVELCSYVNSTSFDASLNNGAIYFAKIDLSGITIKSFFNSMENVMRKNEKTIFPLRIRVAGESLGENFLIGDFSSIDDLKSKLSDPKISGITLKDLINNVSKIKFRYGGITYTFAII